MKALQFFTLALIGFFGASCSEGPIIREMIIFKSEIPNRGFFGVEFDAKFIGECCASDPVVIRLSTGNRVFKECDLFSVPAKKIIYEDKTLGPLEVSSLSVLMWNYRNRDLDLDEICFVYISRNQKSGRSTLIDLFYHGRVGDLVDAVNALPGSLIDFLK